MKKLKNILNQIFKKSSRKKAAPKKRPVKKTPARKSPTRKASPRPPAKRKTPARKGSPKKSPAKKISSKKISSSLPSPIVHAPNLAPSSRHLPTQEQGGQRRLVGLIFQETGGHKRITHGKEFTLLGGTQEVHEAITEATVKTFEQLKRKGKTLQTADPREIGEMLHKNFPKG